MGVPDTYRTLVKDIPNANVALANYCGVSFDLNGILHRVAQHVFGYGVTLNGKKISDDEKEAIRLQIRNQYEVLETTYMELLKHVLTEIVLIKIEAEYYLIICVDGIAPVAKQKQQRNRRFLTAIGRNPLDFDTAGITTGTPFMKKIHNTINAWIIANRSKLPHLTIYSGHDVPGEGEHKIFELMSKIEQRLTSMGLTNFSTRKHGIYGLDSDLFFLTLIRPYNFDWIREGKNIYKTENAVAIEPCKEYIYGLMCYYPDLKQKHNYYRFLYDFVLLSFHIGDDFVPPMFTLDFNNGETLKELMSKYKKLFGDNYKLGGQSVFLLTELEGFGMGQISWYAYSIYINSLIESKLEEKIFTIKRLNQDNEKKAPDDPSKDNKYRNLAGAQKIDRYSFTPLLQMDYDTLVQKWITIVAFPSSIHDILEKDIWETNPKNEIDLITSNFRRIWFNKVHAQYNSSLNFIVGDYLKGLQWNILYYMGYNVNNWYYKSAFAPCIYNIHEFFKLNGFNGPPINTLIRNYNDPIPTNDEQLFLVLHHPLSDSLIASCKISEYDNKGPNKTLRLKKYDYRPMFPTSFPVFVGGKFESKAHTGIVILSNIDINNVLTLKSTPLNSLATMIEGRPFRIEDTKVKFKENEVKTIEDVDIMMKKDYGDKEQPENTGVKFEEKQGKNTLSNTPKIKNNLRNENKKKQYNPNNVFKQAKVEKQIKIYDKPSNNETVSNLGFSTKIQKKQPNSTSTIRKKTTNDDKTTDFSINDF